MNFPPCPTCGLHPHPIYLKLPQVAAIFGISKTQIYEWIKTEGFPKPHKLAANTVRWIEDEVYTWSAAQIGKAS